MKGFEFKELGKIGKSISIQEMKGNDNIYFRLTKLYKTDEGEWRPTNKGVSIPLNECETLSKALNSFIQAHKDAIVKNIEEKSLMSDLDDLD